MYKRQLLHNVDGVQRIRLPAFVNARYDLNHTDKAVRQAPFRKGHADCGNIMHGKTLEVYAGICITGNRFPITDGVAAHDFDCKVRTEAVTFVLRKVYRARLHDTEVMHLSLIHIYYRLLN